ncbi:hypothetical protein [Sinomonas atrocyanea]|uniref:hypothetical protein n=1 Tax=Sinomonas atrocyanea TaxID=37927 RepID=UPI003D95C85D
MTDGPVEPEAASPAPMTRREARRLREAEEAARRAAHVDDSAPPTEPDTAAVTGAHDADGSPRAAAAPAPSEADANQAALGQPSADAAQRAAGDGPPAAGDGPVAGDEPVAGGQPDVETTPATRATAVASGRGRSPRTFGEP